MILLGLLLILNRILRYLLISPTYLFLIFNLLVLLISPLYFFYYGDKFSLGGNDDIDSTSFWNVYSLFVLKDIFFIFGFLFYYIISTPIIRRLYIENFNDKLFGQIIKKNRIILPVSVFLTFLIVILYLNTYSVGLWDRDEYIPSMTKSLKTFAKILSFIAVICLGVVDKAQKPIANFLVLIIVLLTFSTGSRSTFLLLVIYFFFSYVGSKFNIKNSIKFLFNLSLSFILLSYLISFRPLGVYGFKPYIIAIFNGSSDMLRALAFNIYYSFVFGVFATAKTMKLYTNDWNDMFISLNPLPGGMAGWPEISGELAITKFMPFTLYGQVFEAGIVFTLVFFVFIGMIFGYFEKQIRKLLMRNNRVIAVFLTLILLLFIVYSFEYHLRSAFRYIYYALFIYFVYLSLKKIFSYKYKISNRLE